MTVPRDDDLGRPGALTRWMQSRRIAVALPHIRTPVLDIGCGSRAPLAHHFVPDDYVGVEMQKKALAAARRLHPAHRFLLPDDTPDGEQFASVAALAVLEHVTDPDGFVADITTRLQDRGTLVLTTPRPVSERLHAVGGRVGLFSSRAVEEHEQLLDRDALTELMTRNNLQIRHYRRFMMTLNQLVVAERASR